MKGVRVLRWMGTLKSGEGELAFYETKSEDFSLDRIWTPKSLETETSHSDAEDMARVEWLFMRPNSRLFSENLSNETFWLQGVKTLI